MIVYVDENNEYVARFNLSDILDIELDKFRLPDGRTDSARKALFDTLDYELAVMRHRIKQIQYGPAEGSVPNDGDSPYNEDRPPKV